MIKPASDGFVYSIVNKDQKTCIRKKALGLINIFMLPAYEPQLIGTQHICLSALDYLLTLNNSSGDDEVFFFLFSD